MGVGTHSSKRFLRSEEHGEQLLPGIPNGITLELITPKLPWTALRILSCVSRCWEEAIRTKEVYDARVRANSTETLIVHRHFNRELDALALYSTSKNRCYELPRIPWLRRGTLGSCKVIALDGKLYVLGGQSEPLACDLASVLELERERVGDDLASPDVYVLDLAGQRDWEQSASMLEARSRYGCGIMDGKIYVFGGIRVGTYGLEPLLGAEVYDPQENSWSPITHMTRGRFGYHVATLGKELLLHGGQFWSHIPHAIPAALTWDYSALKKEMPLGVYNPAKKEWRLVPGLVERFGERIPRSNLFVAKEKLYSFSQSGIDVYDFEQKSWKNRHANSFVTGRAKDSVLLTGCQSYVLAVNDELFLTAFCKKGGKVFAESYQCKGLDSEKKEMVWQKTNCSFPFRGIICSIQL